MKRKHEMSSRDYATELVEAYILDNGLQPHDRLPSERDMCRMWDLNRTTLRNAIQRLVDDGALYCRMGSGTFVAPPKMIRDLQDVKGFSEAARENGRIAGSRLIHLGIQEAGKAMTRRLRVPLGSPVLVIRRLRTLDGEPCSVETTHINAALCPGLESYDFSSESLFDIMRDRYGLKPYKGEEKLTVTALDSTEAELLGVEEGSPAFYQSGIVEDAEGTVIEHFKAVVLSSQIRFATELTGQGR